MFKVVVAFQVWGWCWQNTKIRIQCSNKARVEVHTSVKARDSFLSTCDRNVWVLNSIYNIHLVIIHIQGKTNCIAYLLSRLTITDNPENELTKLLLGYRQVESHVDLTLLNHDT